MNKAKLLKMFFIAASVLCLVAALVACGEGGNGGDSATLSPEADYKVTVKDALGKPYGTGIIVQYMKDGQQVAMQVVDSNGVAVKTLDRGDYTVELKYTTDDAFYYDKDALVFSAEKTELDVMLSHTVGESDAETVYAEPVLGGTDNEHTAYRVNEGCTYIELDESDRTYVLFTPDRAGTYEFGVAGDTASIGAKQAAIIIFGCHFTILIFKILTFALWKKI